VSIPGAVASPDVEHYTVQFCAKGYVTSLPCPEGPSTLDGLKIHRNGFSGAVQLVRQKPTADGSTLRLILRCGGCGVMWRAETWADAEPFVLALRAEGYDMVADRAEAGYAK
jgi:hypothetical protein